MMDKKYIEMCRSAEEIQEQWEPKIMDEYWDELENKVDVVFSIEKTFQLINHLKWIPQSKEVQFIIHKEKPELMVKEIFEKVSDLFDKSGSWKEDMLIVCMETCYGKRYDSEKKCWVKV